MNYSCYVFYYDQHHPHMDQCHHIRWTLDQRHHIGWTLVTYTAFKSNTAIHQSSLKHYLCVCVFVLQECETSLQSRHCGSMLLERRSLFLMLDEMYTSHLHGIQERSTDTMDSTILNLEQSQVKAGDVLMRSTRVSLTIRHVPKVLKVKLFGGRR